MTANLSTRAAPSSRSSRKTWLAKTPMTCQGSRRPFGHRAWYDNEPWGEHHEGRDAVHGYDEDLGSCVRRKLFRPTP